MTCLSVWVLTNLFLLWMAGLSEGFVRACRARLMPLRLAKYLLLLAPALALLTLVTWVAMPIPDTYTAQMFEPSALVASGPVSPAPGAKANTMVSKVISFTDLMLAFHFLGLCIFLVRLRPNLTTPLHHAVTIRRYKNLRLKVSEACETPFSVTSFFRSYIVIPPYLLHQAKELKICLRHEFHHITAGDCHAAWLLALLRYVFFYNPGVGRLAHNVTFLQELACDRAVLRGHGFDMRRYRECLLWIAGQSIAENARPLGTMAMARSASAKQLIERIETMQYSKRKPSKGTKLLVCSALVFLTAVSAAFGIAATRSSPLTEEEFVQLIEKTNATNDGLIVPAHPSVKARLDKILTSRSHRRQIKASLSRMKTYEAMIAPKLKAGGLPRELMAVPLVESGYKNIAQGKNRLHGAGLWMFIEPTATTFGLKLEPKDERLNPEKLTTAAVDLFTRLYADQKDWNLALMGYNIGEGRVKKAKDELKTNDAFDLIAAGVENDKDYLQKVLAAVVLMKNPDVL